MCNVHACGGTNVNYETYSTSLDLLVLMNQPPYPAVLAPKAANEAEAGSPCIVPPTATTTLSDVFDERYKYVGASTNNLNEFSFRFGICYLVYEVRRHAVGVVGTGMFFSEVLAG